MNTHIKCLILATSLLLFIENTTHAHNGGATAYAIPLEGITIDGKLDDWPVDMIWYPILNHGQVYGETDIEDADLTASDDLTPSFIIGYNQKESLIYLAVRVRDDSLIAGRGHLSTDACEVYVDGLHKGKNVGLWGEDYDAGDFPVLQYLMCPPGGRYSYRVDNPSLRLGKILSTKTQCVFSRERDVSIYEWAIESYDNYPDVSTKLVPGKTIGFDVAVADKDIDGNPAWVCWGPFGGGKWGRADLLGTVVLWKKLDELGVIAGKVVNKYDGSHLAKIEVFIKDNNNKLYRSCYTNSQGRYRVLVEPGTYQVSVAGIKNDSVKVILLAGDRNRNINFAPEFVSISGKVTIELEGFIIQAKDKKGILYSTSKTDSQGRYKVLVEPGTYQVSLSNAKSTDPVVVTLKSGDNVNDIDFDPKEVNWEEIIKDPEVLSLIEAVKIRNSWSYRGIPYALSVSSINTKEAMEALLFLSKDEDPDIRILSVNLLSSLPYGQHVPKVIMRFKEMLTDKNEIVRNAMIEKFRKLTIHSEENINVTNVNINDTIKILTDMLKDKNPNIRSSAAYVFGNIGNTPLDALPYLIEMLEEENPDVRKSAAIALARMDSTSKDVVPNLIKMLKDKHRGVRYSAITAIGHIRPLVKEAIPLLVDMLYDKKTDAPTLYRIIPALANIGPYAHEAVPALIGLLESIPHSSLTNGEREGISYYSCNALSSIGFEARSAIPSLLKHLHNTGSVDPVYAIGSIAQSCISEMNTMDSLELRQIIKLLETTQTEIANYKSNFDDPQNNVSYIQGGINRAIADLKTEYNSRRFIHLLSFIETHELANKPWVWVVGLYILIGIVSISTWFLFLWIHPLWLYKLNRKLRHPEINPDWIGISFGLRQVLLLSFFNYHHRVLDAWIQDNFTKAREQFENLQTVRERSNHVPIPVTIDGNIVDQPSAAAFSPVFNKERFCLLIWGEGGSGKTSLACRLAHWAMNENIEKPLSDHLMFPVIIEHDLHETLREQKHPLLQAIHSQVELITGDDEIEPEFMRHLLKKQRILVIVDRLSEMNVETRKLVQLGYDPELKINALIITSRLKESMHGALINTVEPMRIDKEHLLPFMVAYLKNEDFDDSDYFDACSRLSKVTGYRGITALMAKLYAEQMITVKKEVTSLDDLPDSIPDLMLGYLNWINRNRTDEDPDHRTIHSLSKVIAWASLEETFRPSDALLSVIQSALPDEQNLDKKLSYMSEKLGLIRFVGHSLNRIRFTLDPLSEYLAGLRLLELYGSENEQWRRFIVEADQKEGAPEAIDDFLIAVIDCCNSEGKVYDIPDFVVEELNSRVALYEIAI